MRHKWYHGSLFNFSYLGSQLLIAGFSTPHLGSQLLHMDPNLHCNPPGHPSGRLTRIYNAQERAVIDVFKAQYLEATSPAGRKTIAQVHIFLALFNHWIGVGQVVDDKEMKLWTVACIMVKSDCIPILTVPTM
ncbi:hypothetical protein BYT27DRAFT_7249670 [Phlegmacium glaucopus]|nr:hypothetical protein BYT27DRAFT_7249670 [Phlegmacium glaucopus]